MQHCRALQLQPTELSPAEGRHGACYLQDLIHDFLHDLTLSFRIAGAEKQEEIQVRKEDTERAQGEGGFVLSWLCLGAPRTWGEAEGGAEGGLGGWPCAGAGNAQLQSTECRDGALGELSYLQSTPGCLQQAKQMERLKAAD